MKKILKKLPYIILFCFAAITILNNTNYVYAELQADQVTSEDMKNGIKNSTEQGINSANANRKNYDITTIVKMLNEFDSNPNGSELKDKPLDTATKDVWLSKLEQAKNDGSFENALVSLGIAEKNNTGGYYGRYYNLVKDGGKTDEKGEQVKMVTDNVAQFASDKVDQESGGNATIYQKPEKSTQGNSDVGNIDGVIDNANNFLTGSNDVKYDEGSLQTFIGGLYNISLTIGVLAAVLIGAVLGVKYMMASAEGKAEVKSMLLPYAVGCAIVFGAFGIWKLTLTLLETI